MNSQRRSIRHSIGRADVLDPANLPEMPKVIPVDWNNVPDQMDANVWDKVVGNFWVPEKIPLSQDIPSWEQMQPHVRDMVSKVLAGLTTLDTMQGTIGAVEMIPDALSLHEEAVLTNFSFMESVHARSYSYIFSTLETKDRIAWLMDWAANDPVLQRKVGMVVAYYRQEPDLHFDPGATDKERVEAEEYLRLFVGLQRKIASVMLESLLFYSGFFLPLYLSARKLIPQSADVIKLIVRDEAIHGYYIGYKFIQGFKSLTEEDQELLREETYTLLAALLELEYQYVDQVYVPGRYAGGQYEAEVPQGSRSLRDEAKIFVRYNANKALDNLGFPRLFDAQDTAVAPEVLSALDPTGGENHDFFSGSGSSYVIGKQEETDDDDWDWDD